MFNKPSLHCLTDDKIAKQFPWQLKKSFKKVLEREFSFYYKKLISRYTSPAAKATVLLLLCTKKNTKFLSPVIKAHNTVKTYKKFGKIVHNYNRLIYIYGTPTK